MCHLPDPLEDLATFKMPRLGVRNPGLDVRM
jgi:hypothetical protein